MKTISIQIRELVLRRFRVASLIAIAMLVAFSTNSFALWPAGIYYFGAISGTVVDKETRKPIEGVVVVGHWGLRRNIGYSGTTYTGPLSVKETVTDKAGKFLLTPTIATDIHKSGHFDAELYPEIAFFRSGHLFTVYRHSGKYPIFGVPEPFSTLLEDQYLLPALTKDRTQRLQSLPPLSTYFSLIDSSDCFDFEALIPRLLSSLRAERDRLLHADREIADRFLIEVNLQRIESCAKKLGRKGE